MHAQGLFNINIALYTVHLLNENFSKPLVNKRKQTISIWITINPPQYQKYTVGNTMQKYPVIFNKTYFV